ncbi:monocyte to macrophage differentiation factor-like [Convolutriloba macropyga]|uniref:monocyte to macrophage differentiation factor-like n=1 Tax=Convolutriloba macropyga TaxID=536237 RepID=UPI003F523FCB
MSFHTALTNSSNQLEEQIVNHSIWMNQRPKDGRNYRPTIIEDVANVLTHGIFILPCIWMGCMLYSLSNSQSQSFTAVLYGGALVQLLTCSTVHHLMSLCGHSSSLIGKLAHVGDRVAIFIFIAASYTPWLVLRSYGAVNPRALVQLLTCSTVHHLMSLCGHSSSLIGKLAHVGDRVAIFIFIAASYTPWLVLRSYGAVNPQTVLWIIWAIVVIGLFIQVFYHDEYQNAEVLLYVAVGIGPSAVIIESICFNGWKELAFGGAMYIFGVIFYKLDGIMPFAHAVWHLFVITGALTHYYAIYTNLYKNSSLCVTTKPFFLEALGF